jgi:Uncharacterized protein conserved in bacteria
MNTKSLSAAVVAVGAGVVLALAPAAAAHAHVSASATSTAAGSSTVVTFSVPHGCQGSPTTAVRIELPESIPAVTPTVNANWTVEKTVEQLAEPLQDAHGNAVTERVTSVTYTAIGAGLAEGYRDTFELSLRLPEGDTGDVVAFPTFQTCVDGSADWVGDDAPSITLTAATGDADHHGSASDDQPAAAPPAAEDTLARVFGVAGLVVGVLGVVVAIKTRPRVDGVR